MTYIQLNNGYVSQVMESTFIPDETWIEFNDWNNYKVLQKNSTDLFHYETLTWVQADEITCASFAITDILSKRKQELFNSDWTQIPNSPLTADQQTAWATYRQALRDITKQSGYPFNIIWPSAPN